MDGIHEILQEILRVPSDAGTKLFYRELPVSSVRQMHGNCDRTCCRNCCIPFSQEILEEPVPDSSSDGGRMCAKIHCV